MARKTFPKRRVHKYMTYQSKGHRKGEKKRSGMSNVKIQMPNEIQNPNAKRKASTTKTRNMENTKN
jgi:hypothetical protein